MAHGNKLVDGIAQMRTDLTVSGVTVQKVVGIDSFNGTEQGLNVTRGGDRLLFKGLLIKDFPVFYSHPEMRYTGIKSAGCQSCPR